MPRPWTPREVSPLSPTVDLHIHSIHSDGVLSPVQIVDRAVALRLTAISITDHDTVAGIGPLIDAARDRIEVIPAVEMSSTLDRLDIHILGYYIDHRIDGLRTYLEKYRQFRDERARKIIRNLAADGVAIDYEQVLNLAHNGSLGRPHLAEALLQNGYVHSISEAFARYLGYQSPYYEPKMNISPREVMGIIRHSGGIPVIAHPANLLSTGLIYQLIMDGAGGIEVWHPEHNRRQEQEIHELAIKNGLAMTGGSDYHGYQSGSEIGQRGCRDEDVKILKRHCPSLSSTTRRLS